MGFRLECGEASMSLSEKYRVTFLGEDMGKFSRDKGNRVEREFVNKLKNEGIPACRVPLSGAAGGDFTGDLHVDWHKRRLIAEVKCRKGGNGFKSIQHWLGSNDLLFLKSDRNEPLVVMPWGMFLELATEPVPDGTE